jgi:hypothetical protein
VGEIGYQAFRKKKYGKNKYGAKRTTIAGQSFPSRVEAAVFQLYALRERASEISDLTRYSTVFLSDARISYKPDWSYIDLGTGLRNYVEVKGVETERFRLIKKLWRAYGPGPLEIWKGSWQKPYLSEVIIPA